MQESVSNSSSSWQQQEAEYREAFSLFDTNGDGAIANKQLGDVLRALGQNPTPAELKEMIKEVDTDGSGSIEFEEFLVLMRRNASSQDSEEELRRAFCLFDANNDGFLDVAELSRAMRKLGHPLTREEAHAMLDMADLDGDGRLSYAEFHRAMSNAQPDAAVSDSRVCDQE